MCTLFEGEKHVRLVQHPRSPKVLAFAVFELRNHLHCVAMENPAASIAVLSLESELCIDKPVRCQRSGAVAGAHVAGGRVPSSR